jgi:hypothetical protein
MKIAFINGSPKEKNSSSGCILQELKPFLDKDSNVVSEFCFRKPNLDEKEMEQIAECQVLIFSFPLYVDGIPSHLLNCLAQLESYFTAIKEKEITVYSLINCGFFEGHQNKLALEIMENWCIKTGLRWGQGIGIGGGGMLLAIKNVPIGHGPKKNLGKAFDRFVKNILSRSSGENLLVSANFPRLLYKFSAEIGWMQAIKANGLKRKDLSLRK